jgi:hypothetical protein
MRKAVRFGVVVALAGLLAVAAMACGDDDDNGDDSDNGGAATAVATQPAAEPTSGGGSSSASISVVEPDDGFTVDGDRLEVRVDVEGLTLDGTKIGLPAAQNAGVGHWHIYVDGKYAGLSVSDVISLPSDAMPKMGAGEHEIRVQLHNTDHTPVEPEATDTINVNVPEELTYTQASGDPSISIVEPADGATVDDRVEVQVEVGGFTLDGTKIGQPAAQNPGVGHWHVYVDGKYAGLSVSDVIALPNDAMPTIAAGQHEIKVQLHNTDHTPLEPEVTDTVMVTFQ